MHTHNPSNTILINVDHIVIMENVIIKTKLNLPTNSCLRFCLISQSLFLLGKNIGRRFI